MRQNWETVLSILWRTREAVQEYAQLLRPVVEQAQTDHDRLYYHHFLEEEEQHLARLNRFLPRLEKGLREADGNAHNLQNDAVLIQYLALEVFGLHNFVEHLDLALYEFQHLPVSERLRQLRQRTYEDYLQLKEIARVLAGEAVFDIDDDDELRPENSPVAGSSAVRTPPANSAPAAPPVDAPSRPIRRERRFTVGSLIGQ